MTRGKGQAPTATGLCAEQGPPSKATGVTDGGRKKTAGEKLSREALALLNTSILGSSEVVANKDNKANKARGRPSAPAEGDSPDTSPQLQAKGRGKKRLSAPPAPEAGTQQQQEKEQVAHAASAPAQRKGASSKRMATLEVPQDTDAPERHDDKRQKADRNTQRQEQRGGNEALAGTALGLRGNGSASGRDDANPSHADVTANDDIKRPWPGKSNDKARKSADADISEQLPCPVDDKALNDGMGATDKCVAGQTAAGSGGSKKARKAKGQAVVPGLDNGPEASVPAARHKQTDASPTNAQPVAAPVAHATHIDDRVGNVASSAELGPVTAPEVATAAVVAGGASAGDSAAAQHAPKAHGRRAQQERVSAREPRQAGAPQGQKPVVASKEGVTNGMQPVSNGGAGGAGSIGSARQPDGAVAAEPITSGSAGIRPLPMPVTGTTPIKVFAPVPMPRMDEIGRRERTAVVELQRQYSELRVLYDELKATKIQELEKVLAEQVEYTEEQVRHAEQRANLWQNTAELAEQKAKAAGSQEMADHVATLEAQVEQLLKEKGDLLLRVAQQERILAQAQQAYHDLRAELMQQQDGLDAAKAKDGDHDGESELEQRSPKELGDRKDAAVGGEREDGDGADQEQSRGASIFSGCSPATAAGTVPPDCTDPLAGRCVGLQFPTPSPGIGVQFPTPGVQFTRLQGLMAGVLSAPGSGSRSGPGVSTECLRIVQNLPTLRAPTPSIQSRLAPGAVPVITQTEAASVEERATVGATPVAADGPQGQPSAQPGSGKSRRSTGSPIDGICGSGQRKAGGPSIPTDMSFAHGMGAPEAFTLSSKQQEPYSFIDLNPVSARKAGRPSKIAMSSPRTAAGLAADGAANKQLGQGPELRIGGTSGVPALIAAAAAMVLPPSPTASPQGGLTRASVPAAGGAVLPGAKDPLIEGIGSPAPRLTPSRRPNDQVSMAAPGASPRGFSPDTSAMAAAAVINSGSVVSNQGSCTFPGVVARAMTRQQEPQQGAAADCPSTNPPLTQGGAQAVVAAANDIRSPASASKRPATSPAHVTHAFEAGGAASQDAGEIPGVAHGRAHQNLVPSSPSPRTAKLIMYERMLDWHVDTVSLKPETCRLTHRSSGMSFELRETDLDDEEAEGEVRDGDQPRGLHNDEENVAGTERPKCFTYTPLELGTVADSLPSFLKEILQFPANQRRALLEELNTAIKASAGSRKT